MQKCIFIFVCSVFLHSVANAAPQSTTCVIRNVFTSCNAGYYLSGQQCYACPAASDGCAVTSTAGASGITSCYIKSGCVASDATGTYKYTADCKYST